MRPIHRRQLVRRLADFGFAGPFSGGKHDYMIKETIRLTLPNPHREQISVDLLTRIP